MKFSSAITHFNNVAAHIPNFTRRHAVMSSSKKESLICNLNTIFIKVFFLKSKYLLILADKVWDIPIFQPLKCLFQDFFSCNIKVISPCIHHFHFTKPIWYFLHLFNTHWDEQNVFRLTKEINIPLYNMEIR